ncbi:hypothetical protein BSKO_06274 [Bryopsis sp. KO-2023]|nr:hypothetical protein BSKO_06274 [Bryopsis sp. KO-2023]
MVYHSSFNSDEAQQTCGCPVLPLSGRARGPAPVTAQPDIVDETLNLFRANVLFRSFEVKGPADKLLIYLSLYVSACLKRLQETRCGREEAEKHLFTMAHEAFRIPGDPGFVLNGIMGEPETKAEQDFIRIYLRQCREEAGRRLVAKCYQDAAKPDKFWLAFANKKFLGKVLN